MVIINMLLFFLLCFCFCKVSERLPCWALTGCVPGVPRGCQQPLRAMFPQAAARLAGAWRGCLSAAPGQARRVSQRRGRLWCCVRIYKPRSMFCLLGAKVTWPSSCTVCLCLPVAFPVSDFHSFFCLFYYYFFFTYILINVCLCPVNSTNHTPTLCPSFNHFYAFASRVDS